MALNTLPNEGLTNRGYPSDRIVTPIIINGDMSVAQRATSVTGVTSGTYKTIDRFRIMISSAGTWTLTQSTTVPTGQGFNNSFKYDCTTADASLGSSDILGLSQKIEGFNQAAVKKGTANAEKTTLAFWVRSNKTGTYICELYDDQNTRQVSKSYTIDSANTWEKKVIVFPADTVGANDFDNTQAMQVNWWLAMGSDYTSGTLSETWTAATSANRAVGQVNLADSTDNEWYCTGVQLEVGEFDSTSIPSFPFESFENNLKKCQRYFQVLGDGTYTDTSVGGNRIAIGQRDESGSTAGYPIIFTQCQMRATPSITTNSVNVRQDSTNYTLSSIDTIKNFGMTIGFNIIASSALGTGESFQLRTTGSDGYIRFDAEL